MSDKIISDINGLEPGELVDLFELDLSTGVAPLVVKKVISGATKANPDTRSLEYQGRKVS